MVTLRDVSHRVYTLAQGNVQKVVLMKVVVMMREENIPKAVHALWIRAGNIK